MTQHDSQYYRDQEIDLKRLPKPVYLTKTRTAKDLAGELKTGKLWLKVATIGAAIATIFFVVRYFVGGEMTPWAWDGEQWINAALGFTLAIIITMAQSLLYSSGYGGFAALAGTVLLLFFNLFTDTSQSMERGDEIVRDRSQGSPVFQEALKSIGTVSHIAAAPIASPYAAQLADAETKLAQCRARLAQGKEKHCNGSQARVDSLKSQSESAVAATAASNGTALTGAIQQAKSLEYDENNMYAMIRLIRDWLGVKALAASFLFSLIIIGTFEYAFHFIGEYVSDRKRALMLLGRDGDGNPLDPDGTDPTGKRHPGSHNTSATAPASTPAPASSNTPTASANTDALQRDAAQRAYNAVHAMVARGEIARDEQAIVSALREAIAIKSTDLGVTVNYKPDSLLPAARKILAETTPETLPETLPAGVTDLAAHRAKKHQNLTQQPTKPTEKTLPDLADNLTGKVSGKGKVDDLGKGKVSNAIAAIWEAISDGRLKRSSIPQCKKLLYAEQITKSSEEAAKLIAVALDALEREGVVYRNPKAGNGVDKYLISKTAPAYMPTGVQA